MKTQLIASGIAVAVRFVAISGLWYIGYWEAGGPNTHRNTNITSQYASIIDDPFVTVDTPIRDNFELVIDRPIARQEQIGEMACGPCATWNMLAWGKESLQQHGAKLQGDTPEKQVNTLIKKYGSKPSATYASKKSRYTDENGIASEDLAQFINDILSEFGNARVQGGYLDRKVDEPSGDHLRRVHSLLSKSLAAGVPPILDFRSFAARPAGEDYLWEGLLGHFVAVVGLDPLLNENDTGFRLRYADSYTGRVETAYVHAERVRDFTATRLFSVSDDGTEKWEWITDYPYLIITSPSLQLFTQKEPWHARTIIVLRYAVVAAQTDSQTNESNK